MAVCVGLGLVSLDVILNGSPSTPAKISVGGTCGNVISILSFLGWKAKPISRFSNSNTSNRIFEDLKKFGVDTDLIIIEDSGSTPIIIHRILKDNLGNAKHKFEFKIPETNEWLPRFKPVLASSVESIVSKQSNTDVFFFDRISKSAFELAKFYRDQGAIIYFEPSSFKIDDKLFKKCLEISHIVKFSNDRINNYSEIFENAICDLEIETLGKNGLRYRKKSDQENIWKYISSFENSNVVDSAGAGDWSTAGIIYKLGSYKKDIDSMNYSEIENALIFGQALGCINCSFNGARGAMYEVNIAELIKIVSSTIKKKYFSIDEYLPKDRYSSIIELKDFSFNNIL